MRNFIWAVSAALVSFPSASTEQPSKAAETSPELHKIRTTISDSMQSTARWLDSLSSHTNKNETASAKGYLMFGYIPRTADWSETDTKFKVSLSLPNWEERINLVFDNEDLADDRLAYESQTPEFRKNQESNFNAALSVVLKDKEKYDFKQRVGISRSQLYTQALVDWRDTFGPIKAYVRPSAEYYINDGWGSRLNVSFDLPMSERSLINFSSNAHYVQSEPTVSFANGVYFHHVHSEKLASVFGVNAYDGFDGERGYYGSYRLRQRSNTHWLYYEVEPFIEYRESLNYKDEYGIAFRVYAYYGDS